MKLGTNDIQDLKLGSTNINKVMLGGALVWERGGADDFEIRFTPKLDNISLYIEGYNLKLDGVSIPNGDGVYSVVAHQESVLTGRAVTEVGFNYTHYMSEATLVAVSPELTSLRGLFLHQQELLKFYVSDPSITANITEAALMFVGTSLLNHVDLFDTSNVADASNMFETTGLEEIPDFDLTNVSSIGRFIAASKVKHISLYLPKATTLYSLAENCPDLEYVGSLDAPIADNVTDIFSKCPSLVCIKYINYPNITQGDGAYYYSPLIVAPAPTGTPVRLNDDAIPGVWTNPDPCP
jgi:hypothetical protein